MATLVGKSLGRYQIVERLGRGGMAEVYKAYHPQLERYAAVKVLYSHLVEGQDFLARFQREAKAIAALQHPNIVQVYDFDIEEEYCYMVIEFIDGGSLKDRLERNGGTLPISEILHITKETASALDYAHRRGVLHRDVKPANVLLSKGGRVILADFGIARMVSQTQFTATGALVGTPAYMSPEQGKGLTITKTSDIYSLGVILYELITGQPPFDSDTPLSIIYKHINEPLIPPHILQADISPELEKVILRALAKEPEDRFSTANEMSQALEEAVGKISKTETITAAHEEEEAQPEVIEEEAEEAEFSPDVYKKQTVAMEPDSEPKLTITSKPTVAMEPEETTFEDKAIEATEMDDSLADESPSSLKDEPVPANPPSSVEVADQKTESKPVKKDFPSPGRRVKPLTIALGIGGLIIIALLLVFGLPKLFGGGGNCASVPECQELADEHMRQGNFNEVISAIDTALSFIPWEEHSENAHLLCLRGEAFAALDDIHGAIGSFEECIGWTEGDPGLEDLRMFAEDNIRMLEGQ